MESVDDIFESYELEQEALDDFINEYAGNIRETDTIEEVLYKMNEHLNHVLAPLTSSLGNEQQLQHYIRQHEHLPSVIKTFEELPRAIEDEIEFLSTIDFQLVTARELYTQTVQKALDVQGNNLTEVPGGQPLGMPK